MTITLLFFCVCLFHNVHSTNDKEQSTAGNFTLPTSQEPGPLFGFEFGQNIVDKGDFQVFLYPLYSKGPRKKTSELLPSLIYGISDDLSLFLQFGFATHLQQGTCCSGGVEDLIVQLEYAFYNHDTYESSNQATLIGNITWPTGSAYKNPATGTGSPTVYLGFSASHTSPSWYVWLNPGAVFIPHYHQTARHINFFYQFGFGRNIAYAEERWILTALLEFNGGYTQATTRDIFVPAFFREHDLFVGPSLWFSTNRLILQAGISVPLYERLSPGNSKTSFALAFNLGYKFN